MNGGTDLSNGSEWELSKENVLPRKGGRKMANLSAALGQSSGDYQSRIHREKQLFETELRTYEGSDPLDVWYRYIVWVCENFPTGGRDQQILLERCIALFKDEEKYRNDERYLKIWIQYADLCTDQIDVYNYMYSQGVCSGLAKFYESWAYTLECLGNCKKADEVYTLGINRNAEPVEMLKRQHRAFESRLASNLNNSAGGVVISNNENGPQRTTLGGLKSQGKKGSVGVKRTGNASLGSKKCGVGGAKPLGNSSLGFAIFQDDAPTSSSSIPAPAGEWKMPPTQPIKTKENTQKPGKWNEAKISQRYIPAVPFDSAGSKQSFTVHVDDEVFNNPPCTPQPGRVIMDKVLNSRKPDKNPTSELLKTIAKADNPIDEKVKPNYCKEKIYAGAAEFSFEELRAARWLARLTSKKVSDLYPSVDKKIPDPKTRVMYPKNEVYPLDGQEHQLEEVLARRHAAKLKARTDAPKSVAMITSQMSVSIEMMPVDERPMAVLDQDEEMEIASCRKTERVEAMVYHDPVEESPFNGSEQHPARRLVFQDTTPSPAENLNLIQYQVPPSTLQHTNSAFRPVVTQGNSRQPLGARPIEFPQHASANTRGYTGLAMPNTNGQGMGQVPADATTPRVGMTGSGVFSSRTPEANKSGDTSHLTLPSPTVTINTKAAMDEVMAMFKNPLMSEAPDEPMPWKTSNAYQKPVHDGFEAAFSNENAVPSAAPVFGGAAPAFAIYDETSPDPPAPALADACADNQENRPPKDYIQAPTNRQLSGVLQPSIGIPVCPLPVEDEDEDDDMGDLENQPPTGFPQLYGTSCESFPVDMGRETNPSDVTTYSSFSAAARVASTPFCSGAHNPPSFSVSTIQPAKEEPREEEEGYEDNKFACTPSKMLSPIFERSDEDYRSSSSSSSSTASSGRGSVSHHAAPAAISQLSCIVEEQNNHSRSFRDQSSRHVEEQHNHSRSFHDQSSRHDLPTLRNDPAAALQELHISRHEATDLRHDLSGMRQDPSISRRDHQVSVVSRHESLAKDLSVIRFREDGTTDVNPFSDEVVNVLMSKLSSPVSSYEGYRDCKGDELPRISPKLAVDLGDELYRVEEMIGKGAFAKVYRACKLSADLSDYDLDANEEIVTLKVQPSSTDFEFYICRQLHQRIDELGIPSHMHKAFMNPSRLYSYDTGSVLVDPHYHALGSLLDVVNKYKAKQAQMDEAVVVVYTLSLLRMLNTIHRCGVIHGDVKPDNILVLESDASEGVDLRLVDFGRSIDMRLFPEGTAFTVNCYTDSFQCIEMQTKRPWTTQVDTYGLLGVLHCLVHGEYMKVYQQPDTGRWKPNKNFKRRWNVQLWNKLFDTLLNIPNHRELPSLADLLTEFEEQNKRLNSSFSRAWKHHEIIMSS